MKAVILLVPCYNISSGIVSSPLNDSSFMSSTLFRVYREIKLRVREGAQGSEPLTQRTVLSMDFLSCLPQMPQEGEAFQLE